MEIILTPTQLSLSIKMFGVNFLRRVTGIHYDTLKRMERNSRETTYRQAVIVSQACIPLLKHARATVERYRHVIDNPSTQLAPDELRDLIRAMRVNVRGAGRAVGISPASAYRVAWNDPAAGAPSRRKMAVYTIQQLRRWSRTIDRIDAAAHDAVY